MAIMVTRLGHKDFKKHVIIPVMVVSFMGNNRRGRIIISWFDGEKLIVKMSPLYRFLLQDRAGLFLFTRYLAGEVDMDMTTRRLPGEA
ncbi:uncharacterized protein LDX57_012567 [Aspergillus melleus]|uniref:uncharacterized protein n=1 Tax=Aspergillus melleus TaxID=138277 RepID=UPI001E8EA665|nr:uncharacterized protein LDX57_012567 [Aspergillus melleus]KAH8434935.1 hypothetical protein LDX57_012567 [Aspergillus melleus]